MKNVCLLVKMHLFVISLLLLQLNGFTQKSTRELHVGDTIADIQIANLLNYSSSSVKISDFKDRLLIIDFWATWCTPCIASFPKLDSIQNKLNNKVMILPVTYEDGNVVKTFLTRMSKVLHKLPVTATNDNTLRYIFKHSSLPHYVWIDNRRIIAVSQSDDVTEANILSYLTNKTFKYTLKVDAEKNLVNTPAFPLSTQVVSNNDTTLQKLDDADILIHTALTNYVEGLSSGASFGDSTYFSVRNSTIAGLYKIALFGNSMSVLNTSTVTVEVEDADLYFKIRGVKIDGSRMQSGMETTTWQRINGYCYESKLPLILKDDRYTIMRDELNRYFGAKFGIVGVKEQRKRKCLALIRISSEDKLASKGGEPIVEYDKFFLKMRNMNINVFKDRLAFPLQSYPPIIDETDYSGNIDLEINCNLSDLNSLNRELKKYGLKLEEKEALMETGVIKMKRK